jgi:hypothetical protein
MANDRGQDNSKKVKALLWIYVRLICYRFRGCLEGKLSLPSHLEGKENLLESVQEKAKASLTTVGVVFGFSIAVLAAMLGSQEIRKSLNDSLHGPRLRETLVFIFISVALPYLTIWQERFISAASVESARPENKSEEGKRKKGGKTKGVIEKRRSRSPMLYIWLIASLVFFIVLPYFLDSQRPIFYGAFTLSGVVLILLSTFFLLISLNFYDSATGWRSGEEVEWRLHLATIASHSYVLGVSLTIVGFSLLLCFLSFWFGRVVTFVSISVIIMMIKMERNLWDLRPPTQK